MIRLMTFQNPKVPTTIIFGSFLDTRTAYYFNKKTKNFSQNDVILFGGDGTVPTYSPLIPGLKWIYEKKSGYENSDIQLAEYCSLLSEDKKYSKENLDLAKETYAHLPCSCLKEGKYDLDQLVSSSPTCSHSSMINDPKLIDFILDLASKEETHINLKHYPESIISAINNYSKNKKLWENMQWEFIQLESIIE